MNKFNKFCKKAINGVILSSIMLACTDTKQEMEGTIFFKEYQTPHKTIPFDKIRLEDYLPSVKEAIKRHDAEIEAIVNNPNPANFENTIVALERSGKYLSRVQYAFYNLLSAETSAEMDSIANEISPLETEHSNNITLNENLFKRIAEVYAQKDSLNLTNEQRQLLQKQYDMFVNNGANLSAENKEIYRELCKKISLLELQFAQNVLNATNQYKLVVSEESRLDGLPQTLKDVAAEKAKAKGESGWLFDLTYPSYVPFMKYIKDRDLRKELYMAYNTKAVNGELDNKPVIKELVNTRLTLANLLGHKEYASYVLSRRMAEDKEHVYDLLDKLLNAYKNCATNEVLEVQKIANSQGADFDIMPWDWSFYADKLKDAKYGINDELLKPYFELENVKKGVFGLATKLYGLSFEKNESIPVYHPEVEAYEVFDSTGKYTAVLYTDFHPREGKRGGAWMTEYQGQCINEDGENVRPHVSIVMNFTRPTDSLPSLLTFDEFTTFLHEFGHSIHGMVSQTNYESLSGTNVYRDFVELPSQLLENWAYEKEFLDGFAVHYQTGEPIPAELIEKIKASANFNTGYSTLRQLSFGYLDMAWHTLTEPFEGDVFEFEQSAWKKALILPSVEGTSMSCQFNHIFSGGYSAGYYSYKWAEVLDADAFSVFQQNGIFDNETASRFKTEILEKGGSEHPMILYKRFRGNEPSIDALLRRNGIMK